MPGIAAGLFTLAMAGLVYFSRPSRPQNRRLALVLYFEGVFVGTGVGLLYLMDDPTSAYAVQAVGVTARLILPALYLHFLATLDTPLVGPLRTRPGVALLVALGVGLELLWFTNQPSFIAGVEPVWYAPWEGVRGAWYAQFIFLNAAFFFVGLAVAVAAYFHARTVAERRRAKAFALAFGVRDAGYGAFQFVRLVLLAPGDLLGDYLTFLGAPLLWLVYVSLMAYGVLRTQLFDIEIKIKWTVKQGTVAAVFVGLYIAVSQAARYVLGPDAASIVGLAAAGLLLFAIAPLQRLAGRVADAAMPAVDGSPEYLNLKKLEVYRAALEHAVAQDGTVSATEARFLSSLRAELGLTDRDHAVLEYSVRRALGHGPAAGALQPGALVLGKYRVRELLGEGAFGRTYLVEDTVLGRRVVLKAVRADGRGDPAAVREASAIAALNHPNVVTLHHVEAAGDEAFLVMEHVEGGSLQRRLARGPLGAEEFRAVAAGLLDGLAAVHAAGVLHRDLKPSNVLLTRSGQPKIADFGVARLRGHEETADGIGGAAGAVGTVRFMSPEQARGKRVTARSDLFSAAATLYEAYTGKPYWEPRPGESAVELQMRVARGRAFGPWEGPAELGRWLARALDTDPSRRFGSAAEMARALEAAMAPLSAPGTAAGSGRRPRGRPAPGPSRTPAGEAPS